MKVLAIPDAALPVAKILRKEVAKPSADDLFLLGDGMTNAPRFLRGQCCPMGLHPKALRSSPFLARHWGNMATDDNVAAFGAWWDGLTMDEARRAVDGIWK